jgi:hypothetical protein
VLPVVREKQFRVVEREFDAVVGEGAKHEREFAGVDRFAQERRRVRPTPRSSSPRRRRCGP